VPSVEVNEVSKVATLYLYTGENGYGVYEFKINAGTGVDNTTKSSVALTVNKNTIQLSEIVASIEVYNLTGQRVAHDSNTANVNLAENKGVFIVSFTDINGNSDVHKVIIR
jgi:hypothetical protein